MIYYEQVDECYFSDWMPESTFWNCEYGSVVQGLLLDKMGWAIMLWFSSYLWLVYHVFAQKPARLSRTDTSVIRF